MGLGFRMENRSWRNACCILNCKAFGDSRVKDRRQIRGDLWCLPNCKAFGGSRLEDQRQIFRDVRCFPPSM